jgi:hypothetical protein
LTTLKRNSAFMRRSLLICVLSVVKTKGYGKPRICA